MANKRRPKKTRAPYKRYGPGGLITNGSSGSKDTKSSDDEEDEDEVEKSDVVKRNLNSDDTALNSSSIITPTWPSSKFQKIDVLKFAIINERIKNGEIIEITIDQYEDPNKLKFPVEIFHLILQFTSFVKLSPKYLRVCKLFYRLYLPILYQSPILSSYNFIKFVDTLTSNKSKIGSLVKYLDLSNIIQSGKNSYVSKILRRCSANLEVFVAPQTSFGYSPLISLKNCSKIKVLDLGLVSETVNLNELFRAIQNCSELTHLSFPRSSIEIDLNQNDYRTWPSNLWYLRLSGGITDDFITVSEFPQTIKRLEFAHCPQLKEFAIYNMLTRIGDGLTHLSIQYPMPGLKENSMDFLLTYCENLVFLQITVDYCSRYLFWEDLLPKLVNKKRPLRTLWLESSGGLGQSSKIHPDDLTIAIMEERLPCLKHVRITSKLGWDLESDDVSTLVNLLEEQDGGLYINYH